MPGNIKLAVETANDDEDVHVIILSGNGRVFCSGYDLGYSAQPGPQIGSQEMPWDPIIDYKMMSYCTECYMSLWKSLKPVICKVHGFAVAGGSDIALCCDIIIMEDNAKIGYPPARIWGCPTTAMWTQRVGMTWAKRILLTGDLIDAKTAERINLITKSVPSMDLNSEVMKIANRMIGVPKNQLAIQKMVINQVFEQNRHSRYSTTSHLI